MFQIIQESPDYLTLKAAGTLTQVDYDTLIPALEDELNREGKLRLLIRLEGFTGWNPAALMDDLRFDLRHHKNFDRVAVVGDREWEELGIKLSAPLFSGEMHFFEDEAEARRWVRGEAIPGTPE